MFKITENKGFHITFANGWTASVQWGRGNYCENYGLLGKFGEEVPPSATAEVACWPYEGVMTNIWEPDSDTVVGYLSANKVLDFLNKVAAQ